MRPAVDRAASITIVAAEQGRSRAGLHPDEGADPVIPAHIHRSLGISAVATGFKSPEHRDDLDRRACQTAASSPWRLSDAGPRERLHPRDRAGIRNPSQERTSSSVRKGDVCIWTDGGQI